MTKKTETFDEVLEAKTDTKQDYLKPKGNLDLWNRVQETNPNYTKKAKVGGMTITAIAPMYQVMMVTEQFGTYGETWGFKDITLDYSLVERYDMVVFKGTFFFPDGQFEIINSHKLFMDRNKSMLDDNFAKKIETDTLTKAISKLGFNADIFMGKFDDVRYLNEVTEKYKEVIPLPTCDEDVFNKYLDAILAGTKDRNGILITEEYLKSKHTLNDAQIIELNGK